MNGTAPVRLGDRRDLPLVLPVVEVLRRIHVVGRVEAGLDPVDVVRIPDVRAEIGRHAVQRREDAGEDARPGPDQRIGRRAHIGGQRPVVRVDHELDAVPHVGRAVAQPLGVGIVVRGGVGVEDPLERAVVREHQIGIAIEPEERQRRLRPVHDVPVVEHPAVVGDVLREEDLGPSRTGRRAASAAEQVADPDAARCRRRRRRRSPRPRDGRTPAAGCRTKT